MRHRVKSVVVINPGESFSVLCVMCSHVQDESLSKLSVIGSQGIGRLGFYLHKNSVLIAHQ